jgi:NADH:ubiquinone oxidoreductase subunit 5 (subunit L)/multisubunit Na+/H+ antiporter MnhA subunit
MHRDEGFKRFFNTVLFFYLGYSIVISPVISKRFLLVGRYWDYFIPADAFYRDRYLPVKNGLKVISLYRLGDVCLILAMWMAHHVFQKNITFAELNNGAVMQEYFQQHYWAILFIGLMIVVAVAAKSAQLPFSSWLPRAMEGPTTSSAHILWFTICKPWRFL